MKKFCIVLMMMLSAGFLIAQDTPPAKDTPPKKDVQETLKTEVTPTYRLAFSIFELQEGKRTNQRDFSLITIADGKGPYSRIKIGTKVPIVTAKDHDNTQFTYTDVGLELECSAMETTNNKLSVRIELNLSSFAPVEQSVIDTRSVANSPVFRTISQHLRTVLTPGKPQIIGSMDDVNSNKRFQVEVTATRVE